MKNELKEIKDEIEKLIKHTNYQVIIYKKDTTLYELFNK